MSGSFSALLHSSPVTHDVSHDVTSAHYCSAEYDDRRPITEQQLVDTTSLQSFCNLVQSSSVGSYSDDDDHRMTGAWSSGSIATLMNSLTGPGAEYPSRLSSSYCALSMAAWSNTFVSLST